MKDMKDMKVRLSMLWIFVVLNYLYADVLTIFGALFGPGALAELMKENAGPLQVTEGFLLAAAVLMEISIAMVILSRLLKYRTNRSANIIAGTIKTGAVLASLFVATPTLYYLFFAIIEMACTTLIVWYAWTWPDPEVRDPNVSGALAT